MKTCAFCGREAKKLTKEHLWPAALHRRLNDSSVEAHFFYLSKANLLMDAEPQVKDVCAVCNNGVLSDLDGYICNLWDSDFYRIVPRGEWVSFTYDYNLLSRWLLKTCYNSARIHNSDTSHLSKCTDYILGRDAQPGNLRFHLQLAHPSDLTPEEISSMGEDGSAMTQFEPRLHRIGHAGYMTRSGTGRLVRAVHLQSYVFLIHLFPSNVSPDERLSNIADFRATLPYAVELEEHSDHCIARCEGMDSKESFLAHFRAKGFASNFGSWRSR